MRHLIHLTGHHRTVTTNRVLGLLLAFNAGAVNAGGFLVAQMYTSHMTGFLSSLADNLVLGNMKLVLGAVGTLWAFMSGAGSTAILVNWARHHQLHGTYALPLLLEAILMLLFGLVGPSRWAGARRLRAPHGAAAGLPSWACKTQWSPRCRRPRSAPRT